MVEEQTKMLQEMLKQEREERKKLEDKLKTKKTKSARLKTDTGLEKVQTTTTLHTNRSPLPSQRNTNKIHSTNRKG